MSGITHDTKLAIRALRKQPFFTAVVVLTLGIGIGTNAAIFSIVSGVLWNRLPYPESDRLVTAWTSNLKRGANRWGVSLHDYEDWRTRSDVFADLGAYNINSLNVNVGQTAMRATYAQVTPSLFTTLGTEPQLGRIFRDEENLPGNDNVVIISDGVWRDMFGARPDVVGSTMTVEGRTMTIAGVMPPTFAFPIPAVQLWKPFGMLPEQEGSRSGRWVRAVARLRDGVTLPSAQASLDVLGATLAQDYPETNDGFGIYIEPLITTTVSRVSSTLLILWGTTGFLLLIVCANLANMMLARAAVRARETAVRSALGATRWRLTRQTVIEAIPLALLGGSLGVLMTLLCVRWLPTLVSGQIPRLAEVSVDGTVLLYSLTVAMGVSLAFSLFPAHRAASSDLSSSLRDGTRTSDSRSAVRLRSGMVVTQIALAMTVVIGAGLMVRSLTALLATETGFVGDNVVSARLAPSWSEIPERDQATAMFDQIVASLEALPSVQRVSAINTLPLAGNAWNTGVEVLGRPRENDNDLPPASNRVVLPGYHETMGIPLLRGRTLGKTDAATSEFVVVINQAAADALFPGEDAIGRQIRYDGPTPRTIVGIVGNVSTGLGAPPSPMLYVAFAQGRFGHFQNWGMSFVIKTNGSSRIALPDILQRMGAVAAGVPLYAVQTMDDLVAANAATQQLYTRLLSIFAAIALTLATVGVYSVVSYLVNQRTREIGVRMALGAARATVMGLVVRKALVLAAVGVVIGLVTASLTARALTGLLFDVRPVDPITYATVSFVFVAATALASLEPALRATHVDPVKALKNE